MSTFSGLPSINALNATPQLHWPPRSECGHSVQFYSEDRHLVDRLCSYIGEALEAGHSAVVIATEVHRNALRNLLELGATVAGAIKQGRYIALDAAETLAKFTRDGHPQPDLFFQVIGTVLDAAQSAASDGKVVAFGEMVALLWSSGQRQAALQLEQLWNDLGRTRPFMLHCAYPLEAFRAEDDANFFLNLCREHSSVVPDDSYTALNSDQERLCNIAQLQQKAHALELVRAQRESLEKANLDLVAQANARHEQMGKLSDAEQALRSLSQRLLRVQDEERRRLGTQLHDSVGQYLAVLKMGLDILRSDNAPSGPVATQLLTECSQLLDKSIRELRSLSYLLYPPMMDETGLQTSFSWYVDGFSSNTGIRIKLDIMPELPRLPSEIELTLFRVLQESLTNVHRHSGSSDARVRLRVEDRTVRLEVSDSGKGLPGAIQAGQLGVGLRAMEERLRQLGGHLQLSSNSGGAVLTAAIPLA